MDRPHNEDASRARAQAASYPRRTASQMLILAMILACSGCTDGSADQRYRVANRPAGWSSPTDAQPTPPALSVTWTFGGVSAATPVPGQPIALSGDDAWHSKSYQDGQVAQDTLTVVGLGSALITGPHGFAVDPEIQHTLVLRGRAQGAETLVVQWRAAGQSFVQTRRTSPMPLNAGSSQTQTWTIPLSTLRGIRGAGDAEDGLELLLLRFTGRGNLPVTVELDSIALLSHFDDPAGRGFVESRLQRQGVSRDGLALRAGAAARIPIVRQAGDRLRLGLAAVGTSTALDVTFSLGDELTSLSVPPGHWRDLDLDLDALPAGKPGWLSVQATSPDGDERATLLVGAVLHLRPDEDRHPDVVLYVEDTLRADRLAPWGGPAATSEALSRLAEQGVVLDEMLAPSSWTRPSMTSLLTSLSPPTHGNQTHTRRASEDLTTLAETLAEAGWLTVSLVTNYHAGAWAGLDQGFDHHHEPRAHGADRLSSTLTSAAIHEPLTAVLERHADVRLFVFAHSLDPHAPYEPPGDDLFPFLGEANRRAPPDLADQARWSDSTLRYDAEIRHNDHWLGRLDEALEATGHRDNTLLLFTSDHGEAFGERGLWEHRTSLHAEEVTVPFLARWPARLPAGRRVPGSASLLDIAPTVTGLLEIDTPEVWTGRDLGPWLAGEPGPLPDRPLVLDMITGADHPRPGHEMAVVSGNDKLHARVVDGRVVPTALFDRASDPDERIDRLPDADPDRVAELSDLAQRLLDAGPVADEGTTATSMDAALLEWMRRLGYVEDEQDG